MAKFSAAREFFSWPRNGVFKFDCCGGVEIPREGVPYLLSMVYPTPSACYVVLAAVVVVYAQRHSQQESHIQYAQLGTDVTIPCGSVDQEIAVTWTANSTDLDASHLNGSRLVLRNVDLSQSGQYSCYEGPSWHLKYRVNLKVGTPPKEPVLMCRSNNYPNGFYCSWHLPSPTHIPDTFNITVTHDSKEIVCEKDASPKNRCYIRYLHLFSTKKYKVTLTVTNALGSSATSISFDEFAIVKPDPPENVVARPIPNNPRRLLVTWQYPSSWPDPDSFPLKFFLRYRPLIIDQWQHVELSDGTLHTITDAYAGKEYIIQVAAKDNEIGTWSDWSVAVHATPWTEEPKHLTTEAQGAETTTSTTSAFMVPPTTRIYDPEERSSDGAVALPCVAGLLWVAFSIHFI
ncbi:ciliary neurotrophic factor receptor subunit alpha isoform X1 [Hemicordylus capensis]|uniref:ciliary neurotrophic factor receptor subunit alpha isoform X1 n=2 Tax=Hemicordylus capensis TaxID=884348 RepID=UPI002302D112|nr:ciliary neurotrophic factor receptor subunit alpha isoform X1 [Hemicordylus capensis]